MRDFKGIKRQRNRNRNGGGGGGGGSGGKPQNNANRAFDSNGPEGVKVRGAAQHVYEKYQQLARDAHTSGDRVLAENHLQHAEHYFRLMRAMQPLRPLSDIIGRDQFVSGYDIDFEDENPQGEAAESESETAGDTEVERTEARDDRGYRDQRPRDDSRGDDRGDRQGVDRQFRSQRDDRFRDDRQRRDDRPRVEQRQERGDRPEQDRFVRTEPRQQTPYREDTQEIRRELPEPENGIGGQVLRADDGEVSYAPAFLQARAPETRAAETKDETTGEARRPRRRRAPREFTDAAPASGSDEV